MRARFLNRIVSVLKWVCFAFLVLHFQLLFIFALLLVVIIFTFHVVVISFVHHTNWRRGSCVANCSELA
jgi:hypothetical protein